MTRLSKALLLATMAFMLLTASAFALTADVTLKVNGVLPNGTIQMIPGADNVLEFWITNSAKIKGMSLGFELSNSGQPYSIVKPYGDIPYVEDPDLGTVILDSCVLKEHGTNNNFLNSFGIGNLFLDLEKTYRDTLFIGGADATAGQLKNIAVHLTSTLAYSIKIRIPAGQAPGLFCVKPIFVPPAGAWLMDAGTNLDAITGLASGSTNPKFQGLPTGSSGNPTVTPVCSGPSGPSNTAPVVSDIPNQTIAEGGAFATISLDDYVSDAENTDAEMTWTYSGNSLLGVSIVNRVATITIPNADWNGSETITFKATDPDGLFGSDPATFTVTAVNDAPVVTDIPNQTIAEGGTFATISLDNYVSDVDNTDAEMTWTYSGNSLLAVSIVNRVATITTPNADWNGSETITFKATDPGGLFSSDPATFTVTAVNDAPVVTNIPNQTIAEGGTFATISLDNYVSDVDNTDAEMAWTYSGNSLLAVSIVDRVATITTPNPTWIGSETITFKATDPGGLFSSDPATFTVTEVNSDPVVSDIPNQTIAEGGTFAAISLDSYVADAESPDNLITWAATSASPNSFSVNINAATRVATISFPGGEFSGSALFTFTATDPGALSASDTARFTVTPVNDPPIVAGIPDQILPYGATFATINLDDYVTDPDNVDAEMAWSYAGNSDLTVVISGARVATISKPSADWNGSESIIFTATDPELLFDSDTATFSISASNPIIEITPDTLTLTAYAGGSDPAGQVMVTNAGNGTLDWNASETTTWLSLSSTSGPAPSGFTVNTDIAGLAPGSYLADVTVTSVQASNSPQVLKVILNISNPVDIKLTPDSLSFYARKGAGNPPSKDVGITNAIPSEVEFNWGAVETSPWLSMSATIGTSPSTVSFSVDIFGLDVGTYNTMVEIKQVSLKAGVIDDIDTIYVKLLIDQPTGVEDEFSTVPKSYSLKQNYPNPFNPETVIEYNLVTAGHVTLSVFNVLGQKIVDVVNGYESAGNKQAIWNGRDETGREVESGVYFYRLTTDNFSMTRKMMLLK